MKFLKFDWRPENAGPSESQPHWKTVKTRYLFRTSVDFLKWNDLSICISKGSGSNSPVTEILTNLQKLLNYSQSQKRKLLALFSFLFFHWQRIVLGETFLCWHWGSVCICVARLFQWINQSSSAMTKSQYFPANFQCLTWNLSVHCFKSAQKSGHGSEIWIHLALPNHHNITIQCSELGRVKI